MTSPEWPATPSCDGLASPVHDPWFPEGKGAGYRMARRICNTCPIQAECLRAALKAEGGSGESARHGMFGGKSPAERAHLGGGSVKNPERVWA